MNELTTADMVLIGFFVASLVGVAYSVAKEKQWVK